MHTIRRFPIVVFIDHESMLLQLSINNQQRSLMLHKMIHRDQSIHRLKVAHSSSTYTQTIVILHDQT